MRIDIPDETDPEHNRLHGRTGRILDTIQDDASAITGDERDATLYRIELADGTVVDVRWRDLRPL